MNELFAPPESGLLISYLRVSLEDENTGESESISNQRDLIGCYLKQHPEDWNAANIPDDTLIMGYAWYKEKKRQDIPTSYYWKTSEKSRLQLLRKQGYSIREIAEKMGRSESSIKYKLYGERRG